MRDSDEVDSRALSGLALSIARVYPRCPSVPCLNQQKGSDRSGTFRTTQAWLNQLIDHNHFRIPAVANGTLSLIQIHDRFTTKSSYLHSARLICLELGLVASAWMQHSILIAVLARLPTALNTEKCIAFLRSS